MHIKVAEERIERNEHMKELRAAIGDALAFVELSEPLKLWEDAAQDSQLGILARVVHQVTECCRFLRAYGDEACRDGTTLRLAPLSDLLIICRCRERRG